ncbi:MAG TPA: type II secretion system secretin GspD [Polyangia bacterium]
MRSFHAVAWLVLSLLAALRAQGAEPAPKPPATPGANAFLGCEKYPADKKFKWSVRGEVGVAELASSLGQISCRPIVVAAAIAQRGGKVVIEVPELVTAADVYRLFYGALEAMGLSVDTSGGAIKIVDAGRAKEIATPELGASVSSDDRYIVRLVHPKHAAPQELAELLAKLKSKDGDVSVFGQSAVVVIDRAGNAKRMEELARALDVGEAGARIFTLQTHGQSPTDLAASLEKILGAATHRAAAAAADPRAPAPKSAAIAGVDADVRALVPLDNAHLLAVIGSDAGFARVQAVAARIDPPADDGAASQGHVIYLANTNAEDVATTLQTIGLGGRSAAARPAGQTAQSGTPSASAMPGAALPLSGDVRIGADKTSNALVVFANSSDFLLVRDLVQKLDVQRRQVYVEAVILDLSVDKMRTLGLSWHQTASNGSTSGFAAASDGNVVSFDASSIAAAASGGGLVAGVLGSSFNLFGKDIPSFGVILQALERTKDANIISRPHLLTMDNIKATLSVGQVIRYATQSLSNGTGGAATALFAQSYTPQDVALKLELTPHLNESSSIRLEINGEISDIPDGQAATPGGPTIDKRTITTAVVVQDGQTVVLGGLTRDTDTQTIEKIPFLGDIPLLGRLFQTRSKQRVKQDLLIVLTPYIIRGPEDVRRIEERREQERREFIERYSAFADEGQFDTHVDYRRKRGLLEEVNVTALAAEREADALRAAERALKPTRVDGAIALEPAD